MMGSTQTWLHQWDLRASAVVAKHLDSDLTDSQTLCGLAHCNDPCIAPSN